MTLINSKIYKEILNSYTKTYIQILLLVKKKQNNLTAVKSYFIVFFKKFLKKKKRIYMKRLPNTKQAVVTLRADTLSPLRYFFTSKSLKDSIIKKTECVYFTDHPTIILNKSALVSFFIRQFKGYITVQLRSWLIYTYIYLIFFKHICFIIISRGERNTFFNIVNANGITIQKHSTGQFAARDQQKGRKKKLAYTSILTAHSVYDLFLQKKKKLNLNYTRYILVFKKFSKYFNCKSILSTFMKKRKVKIYSFIRVSKKPFGFGCKLRRQKRKRTRRYKKIA